jgi:hypothetical protein
VKSLVGTLRRLKFLAGAGDIIEAGPLLELGLDGERLVSFVEREPLADLLKKLENGADVAPGPERDAEERALSALSTAGSAGAQISELERATGISRIELAKIITNLRAQGKAEQLGTGYRTRYRALGEP